MVKILIFGIHEKLEFQLLSPSDNSLKVTFFSVLLFVNHATLKYPGNIIRT